MAESQAHMDLVKIAYEYIESIVPEGMKGLIQCDTPITSRPTKVVGGYIPDIYFWNGDLLIIGEAKTLNDFDNKHSKMQIEAYFIECSKFFGKGTLVLSVPWQLVFSVKNYVRSLRRKYNSNFDIVVINELGWKDKI